MQTIFVSMIGLEERVMGVFREGEAVADEYLLFVNKEFENDPRVNTYRSEILGKYLTGKQFKLVHASYYDPFTIVKEFNRLKSEGSPDFQQGKIKVALDISTFNRQNLLVMLFLFRRILKVSDIEIIYTVPKQVNQEISRGAAGFSNVPFFGGQHSIDKKRLLMLLAGYEIDRPLLLWRELQPSKIILAEGIENGYKRHAKMQDYVRSTLKEMGLKLMADDAVASKSVTSFWPPEGIEAEAIRKELRTKYNIIVAGGQGELKGKIIRIGHMGGVTMDDLKFALDSLKTILADLGYKG